MSKQGMIGMELAAQEMLGVGESLTDEQWHLPSGAKGWSVKDVVAHAGCLMAFLVAAVGGAAGPDMGIEELNEVQVAQKRGLDGAETMAFVRGELATALKTFAPLQEEPLASTTAQLQDLGTYPLHAIVDMFTFDITTHLRYDIVKPRGPIEATLRPLDERQLGPAVSWLLAGIPRMQPKLPREFAGPLGLDLTGPAGTRAAISSDGAAITVASGTESTFEPRAIITSSADDFLAWSTKRLPWQQLVSVEGNRDEAARFLNALNLV
jgi:uncharacterized protein (TIGR03083 family)